VAFLDGGLDARKRSVIEGHVAGCSACAELMTWAAADQAQRSGSDVDGGRPLVGHLAPGSRVDRYQVLGAVGRGGMGEVYAAYHPDLDRKIALKVVHESGADSSERRARLLREARAIARLSHPNVVSVYDAGTVDGGVYVAMEFVEGETVDSWLRGGPRSWRDIVDVFIAAARGLEAAHAAGIIHRDFKPQNVMIGRDGVVRVMDFGLARFAEEPPDPAHAGAESERPHVSATVTKTGALVGTPAYMAPEQFHGEAIDARADQFSFCVALHEALFGQRPGSSRLEPADAAEPARTSKVPSWLRSAVMRGLADDREQRFSSMGELTRALAKGRSRPRRRALAVSVVCGIMLVAGGGWRVARAGRIHCEVPTARLEAAWSGHDDSRRQTIHRAFVASGRPTAELSWARVAKALDDYVRQWSAMYVETCEATHVRGDQSAEVLDLRMSCLAENLEDARVLTSVLSTADANIVSHAVAAAQGLTPIVRCADLSVLRSAVPMPRDTATLEKVRTLRASLKEAQVFRDMANFPAAYKRASALQSEVEASKYGPLLGELLELIGCSGASARGLKWAEETWHEALFISEAARDDATAARVAADLIMIGIVEPKRIAEAQTWFRLCDSVVDRLGPAHERVRAWALNNLALVHAHAGDFEGAEKLMRRAIEIKERVLGIDHPDVAISLADLANIFSEGGRPAEALEIAPRALDILSEHGDPESPIVAIARDAIGTSLIAVGRAVEAESLFGSELERLRRQDPSDPFIPFALQGIGTSRLASGHPEAAVPFLEDALRRREASDPIPSNIAESRFSLARALWDSARDRRRALNLAMTARQAYAAGNFRRNEQAVADWLATHRLADR